MVVRRSVGGVIIHRLAKGGHGVKKFKNPCSRGKSRASEVQIKEVLVYE